MVLSKQALVGAVVCSVLIAINHSYGELRDYNTFLSTITFLNALELNKTQARELLPIVREALKEKEKIEEEILGLMQNGIKAYGLLKQELAVQQPTEESEASASRAHGQVIDLYQVKLVKNLLKYEREIDNILTAYQIAYLVKYDSGTSPLQGAGIANEIRKEAIDLLESMQEINSFKYDREKYKSCFDFLNSCIHYDFVDIEGIDIMYEIERMISVLDRSRKMFRSDYENSMEELINGLCPKTIQSRPVQYGTRYIGGEPLEVLSKSSTVFFTSTTLKILEDMAGH